MPLTRPEQETDTQQAREPNWHVVVRNDPVNLMEYVVLVFRRVLGFDLPKATKHMREVHEIGRSTVWTGGREEAELYVHQLQEWQLDAVLVEDDQD